MSDIKFSCPHCSQHIACDAQWGGLQIKCPECQSDVIIPVVQARVVLEAIPLPSGPLRVTVPAAPPPPPAPLPAPQYTSAVRPPGMPSAKADRGNRSGKIIAWTVVMIVAPIVIYFAFSWASSAQKKMNVARERERENSGGGQLGHIAELNSVLEATDTAKMGGRYDRDSSRSTPIIQSEGHRLNPPQWTLDLAAVKIPSGKANGSVSGAAFVADRAFLEKSTTGYVLTVRQGDGFQADREVLIYLTLKAGEKLDQKSWANSKDQTNGVSRIVKRWLAGGRQQTKSFPAGYAMKVEFGQTTGGSLPARLFIALPDEEKTVVGGSVEASFLLAGNAQPRPVRTVSSYDGDY